MMDDTELVDIVDPHIHARSLDGAKATAVLPYTSKYCAYTLPMPNTPPLLTALKTIEYCDGLREIIRAANHDCTIMPCMMLDDDTTPDMIAEAKRLGVVALKAYPIGVTTSELVGNREHGVSDFRKLVPTIRAMEVHDLVLCIHGEVPGVFCMWREREFIPIVDWLAHTFPNLRIVVEHITTTEMMLWVLSSRSGIAASITGHHLMDNLDVVMGGKLNPHHFNKPMHKTPIDQRALQGAAMATGSKFFFGSDSAPHAIGDKECAQGCAGAFTATHVIEMVATVFSRLVEKKLLKKNAAVFSL